MSGDPTEDDVLLRASLGSARSALNEGLIDLYMQLSSRQFGENIYEASRKPQWNTYNDAFQDLLKQGATLIADRNDLGINRKLNMLIPKDAKLFVVYDPDTHLKIKHS